MPESISNPQKEIIVQQSLALHPADTVFAERRGRVGSMLCAMEDSRRRQKRERRKSSAERGNRGQGAGTNQTSGQPSSTLGIHANMDETG
jgi:hypothetical protein